MTTNQPTNGDDYTRPLDNHYGYDQRPTLAYSQNPPTGPVPPSTSAYPESYDPRLDPQNQEMGYHYPEPAPAYYPPEQAPLSEPAAPPARVRESFDLGVDVPRYLGSAFATAAVAGILAYIGSVIIEAITTKWVSDQYWVSREIARPVVDGVMWGWVAAAAAVVAAGVMWVLLKITNRAGSFFAMLALLAAVGIGLGTWLSGPWQATIGPAVLGAGVVAAIGVLTAGYTRLSMTEPERY